MPSLIGTGAEQVPVNSMLGSLAYQNAKDVKLGNLSYSGTLIGSTGIINIGSGQIYKDASGNVGIGTITPVNNGRTLTISNTGTGISTLYLQNGASGGSPTDGLNLTFDSGSGGYLWNYENLSLIFGTNNTVRLRIDQSGWTGFYQGGSTVYIGSGLLADGTTNDSVIRWDATGALKICKSASTIAQFVSTGDFELKSTGYLKLPEGTTAQRPGTPQEGMIRKNSTLGVIEGYSGGSYVSLEAGRLINIFESMTSGVDSTFNVSPKTSYIIVEMIAGGGGGGGYAGSLSNNTVGLGRSGTPGCAVRFIIKPSDLVSTYYYRIGAGGASSATGTGTDGGDTIFSKESTSGTMTNYLQCGGGIGGTVGAIYTPPVHLQYASWPGLTIQGTASAWVKLETTEGYTGENILAVSSDYAAFRSRDQLATFNQITSRMDCFYYTGIGYRGVGGGGRESKQTSGGVLTSILNATAGLGGMIRIYEYS